MCGIAGIVGRPDRNTVEKMLQCMRHRGPDDAGIFEDSFLSIGMNRLSIQDTSSSGHQPMATDDKRYWIVFNGEVYNFLEIRDQLIKAGHTFHSSSDTEVVLKAYVQYGLRCLDLFRGMFAFVIYDNETRTLFAARDRFGIKPFYYVHRNQQLTFASELKGIFASGSANFEIPEGTIKSILLFGTILQGQRTVKDVQSLEPAHYLILKDGQLLTQRYWHLSNQTLPNKSYDYEEAKDIFREKFKEAVDLSFISDRSIGVFLSAGIDSVSILAGARMLGKENVKTFTVGFEARGELALDETSDAQGLAKHFGYENETVVVHGADFKKGLDSFVDAIDFPSMDGLNTFLVSQCARQHLVVALSGLGSDEFMSGYARDRAAIDWTKQSNPLPEFVVRTLNYIGKKRHRQVAKFPLLKKLLNGLHSNDYLWNYYMLRQSASLDTLQPLLREDRISKKDWMAFYEMFEKYRSTAEGHVNRLAQLELNTYMTNQLLRDMDAVSMYNSMEVRFPFLDHQLAEFLFSLPDGFKVRNNQKFPQHKEGLYSYEEYGSKRILLDAFSEYLPVGYTQRKKRGFSLPLLTWLHEHCREEMMDTFDGKAANNSIFSAVDLRQLRDDLRKNQPVTQLMWLVFLFLKWETRMKGRFFAAGK